MVSILKEKQKAETSSIIDSIRIFIQDLGFQTFIAILLIYNSYQMQNYLISTNERREAQLAIMGEAIRQMSDSTNKSRELTTENNAILRELRIQKIIREEKGEK